MHIGDVVATNPMCLSLTALPTLEITEFSVLNLFYENAYAAMASARLRSVAP